MILVPGWFLGGRSSSQRIATHCHLALERDWPCRLGGKKGVGAVEGLGWEERYTLEPCLMCMNRYVVYMAELCMVACPQQVRCSCHDKFFLPIIFTQVSTNGCF